MDSGEAVGTLPVYSRCGVPPSTNQPFCVCFVPRMRISMCMPWRGGGIVAICTFAMHQADSPSHLQSAAPHPHPHPHPLPFAAPLPPSTLYKPHQVIELPQQPCCRAVRWVTG